MSSAQRLDRIAELLQENELLRAEIAELKAVALPTLEEAIWARLMDLGVRLSETERNIVAVLVKREIASRDALMFALYQQEDDDPLEKIVDVYICKIRSKLKPIGVEIETIRSYGFRLTSRGKEILLGVEPKPEPLAEVVKLYPLEAAPEPAAQADAGEKFIWGNGWGRPQKQGFRP